MPHEPTSVEPLCKRIAELPQIRNGAFDSIDIRIAASSRAREARSAERPDVPGLAGDDFTASFWVRGAPNAELLARLDGVALREWDIDALRRQFALVSQDVVMFNDSLCANVALGLQCDRARVLADVSREVAGQRALIRHVLDDTTAAPQLFDALARARATRPQADLPASRRHGNVRGAFTMRSLRSSVEGAVIVLVDDVSTTGATIDACARTLKLNGAAEVRALTAARVVSARL